MAEKEKKCKGSCGQTKPIKQFARVNSGKRSYYRNICQECRKAHIRTIRKNNRQHYSVRQRRRRIDRKSLFDDMVAFLQSIPADSPLKVLANELISRAPKHPSPRPKVEGLPRVQEVPVVRNDQAAVQVPPNPAVPANTAPVSDRPADDPSRSTPRA